MTIVTTSLGGKNVAKAQQIALDNNWLYIDREEISSFENVQEFVFVVENQKNSLHLGNNSMFFHPGMSLLRIKNLSEGEKDRFAEACKLTSGDSMLDCTLGMAADAIVASSVVGSEGKVIGLEAVKEIAILTEYGLANYKQQEASVAEIFERIKVIHTTALKYLEENTQEFDCIYFDPMFKKPNLASSGINMLRPFAWRKELTKQEIELALKYTKKCVVVKEMSLEKLQELQPDEILGGKNTRIFYARWNK